MASAQVFNSFGCSGQNVSPALSWSHAPAGTQSFALLVHDPDAPTGSGWWHWLVYDIPATVTSLPAGAGDPKTKLLPPSALQGRTDFGTYAYGGPCPPPGKLHHYHFRLYALKVPKLAEVPGMRQPPSSPSMCTRTQSARRRSSRLIRAESRCPSAHQMPRAARASACRRCGPGSSYRSSLWRSSLSCAPSGGGLSRIGRRDSRDIGAPGARSR